MAITDSEFHYVAALARDNAAIIIEPGKEYLVETRLDPLARREGFDSLSQFINRLRECSPSHDLHAKVVDALTTNETLFFRDFHPFEALRQSLLPQLIAQRQTARTLTIWSAACSTGQEPYSLAMLLREHFPLLAGWRIRILASDISTTALSRAREGVFSQLEINRGLPASYLAKYFIPDDGLWRIKDEIKAMIEFKRLNLVQPWPMMAPCDLVLLRNVMIYFNVETKRAILKRLREFMPADGWLLLGTAETTINLDPAWKMKTVGKAVAYQAG